MCVHLFAFVARHEQILSYMYVYLKDEEEVFDLAQNNNEELFCSENELCLVPCDRLTAVAQDHFLYRLVYDEDDRK